MSSHSSTVNNVDPAEQQKFAELAAAWWDLNGPMRPLHQINPVRINFITQQVSLAQQTVVDIGCGGGILTEGLAHLKAKAIGVDINSELIAVAKQHAIQNNLDIEYRIGDIENLFDANPVISTAIETEKLEKTFNRFPVITCMELLEHVPDPKLLMERCALLLQPGGKIFFSTLNRTLKSFLGAIVAAEYILNILPRGTHQYSRFIQPAELVNWANQVGFHLVDLQGITYRPFKKEFELCTDVSINYIACFEKS